MKINRLAYMHGIDYTECGCYDKLRDKLQSLRNKEYFAYREGYVITETQNGKIKEPSIYKFDRDFIKERKEFKKVILQERIKRTLNIEKASFNHNHITLIDNINYIDPIYVNLIVGELTQVLINILNNAKDTLIKNQIVNPWIKIDLEQNERNAIITIEDNAGGIPEDILPHIFEPYFTTKHQSQGTGLGLYMSYKIVVENLNGQLYVNNSQFGAKFFIVLETDLNDSYV